MATFNEIVKFKKALNFGSQNISTSGDISATGTGKLNGANGGTLAGTFSSTGDWNAIAGKWSFVDVASFTVSPKFNAGGAGEFTLPNGKGAAGQVPVSNGNGTTDWATIGSSGGPITVLGAIPIGGVIAVMSHLAGAYNCIATTAADAAGFVVCEGQTISDATSPMNGSVVTHINDDVFLMGHATAGTAGGANSRTLTTTELPAHSHTIGGNSGAEAAHTHPIGGSSGADASHTHAIDHDHASYSNTMSIGEKWDVYGGSSYSLYSTNTISGVTGYDLSTLASGNCAPTSIVKAIAPSPLVYPINVPAFSGTSGAGSSHTHTMPANTTAGSSHTHSMPATTGTSAAASSYDQRPKYITAKYVMRIK